MDEFPYGRPMTTFVDAGFVKEHLNDGRTQVLNVLPEDQFRRRHIPGSLNAPVDDAAFDDRVKALIPDKSTPVIVHCSDTDCQASTRAARRLQELGYADVKDFKAGTAGWKEAGHSFEGKSSIASQGPLAPEHEPERQHAQR